MQVEVRLFGDLQKYLPENSSSSSCRIEIGQGESVKDILRKLRIPSKRFSTLIILANGTHANLDYVLRDEDVLSVFTAIAGG